MADAALGKPTSPTELDQQRLPVEPEPWPNPVNCSELLDEVTEWIGQYVDAAKSSLAATTLWAVATWFIG